MIKFDDCKNMTDIRVAIDEIDNNIVNSISLRSKYVKKASEFKTSEKDVRDTERVKQVINSKKVLADKYGISSKLIENIYTVMIEHFINSELDEWKSNNV
jgi:isochorismate pyruvate lyase